MCTEIETFDVNNATKNYEKIIDLGPYKRSGKVMIRDTSRVSYMPHTAP